ncbi:MAG: RrF2 family transcriptional regulator [Acidimicrobiia bacterium]
MRLSEGIEWGLHCATLVAILPHHATLPASRLAEYHGVPGAYLAKHLQVLSRAGILESVPGPSGGYRLARPAAEITVLDVVEAIDGTGPAFTCTEIRRRGPAAVPAREYRLPCSIHVVMDRADAAWRAELQATTLADLVEQVMTKASPQALVKGAARLQEVVR